jgi:spermidine synthase
MRPSAVHAWLLFASAALLGSLDGARRLYVLYLAPADAGPLGAAAAIAGALVGFGGTVVSDRRGASPERRLGWELVASGSVALAAALGPFATFGDGRAATVACALLALAAATTAAAARDAFGAVGRPALALGLVDRVLGPLGLGAAAVGLGAAAALSARLGFFRSELCLSAWLAFAGATHPSAAGALAAIPVRRSRALSAAASAVLAGALSGLVHAHERLPMSELERYPDEIVHAVDGAAHRYAVAAAPGGYELFEDFAVRVASLDAERYAAAVTRPLLSAVPRARRILLVLGGTGTVERELLADPRVEELTVVADDPALVELARRMPWLARRSGSALTDRRCRIVYAEPAPFLAQHPDRYDAIVATLPPPTGYRAGKYYTRHFFGLLGAHLTPEGAFVVPATSAFSSPGAFSSVLATLRDAGFHVLPYHSGIPTLGLESFAIASPRAIGELAPATGLFESGKDLLPGAPDKVSTLHEQHVVDAFAKESFRN